MAFIDFETFNAKHTIKVGASKYALYAEIMCMSYSLDGKTVKSWIPGQPVPQDLYDAILRGEPVHAHNANFEINIWEKVMVPMFGAPPIPIEQWRCTMSECFAVGLPGGLENVAKGMELDVKKDMEGRKLMLKMTKPRKPTKKDPSTRHNKPEQFARLTQYCDQDVLSETAVHERVPRLSKRELSVYHYDQKVNRRGIKIDLDLARAALDIWSQHVKELNAELYKITDGRVTTGSEVKAMTAFLEDQGVEVHLGLKKEGVKEYLEHPDLSDVARRVLEIRQELALSSIAKYKTMLAAAELDGRIRGCLQYHAAQTGRWGGRLIQPQNMTRGHLDESELEYMVYLVKKRDIKRLKLYMPIGDLLSSLLRSTIVADKGKKLIVCDLNAIEARAVAWSAEERWLVRAFLEGKDPYCAMAADIYGRPITKADKTERFLGKTCLGAETVVVTSNGPKKIVDVTTSDLLWDGIDWVRHDGLIYQGEKPTLTKHGLTATTDHKVLTQTGWQLWGDVSTNLQSILSALSSANLPSSNTSTLGENLTQGFDVLAVGREWLTEAILTAEKLRDVRNAEGRKVTKSSSGNTNLQCFPTSTERDYSTDCHLLRRDATTQRTKHIEATVVEESLYSKVGEKIKQVFSNTFRLFQVGTIQPWIWTGKITTKVTNRETLDSVLHPKTARTNAKLTNLANESCILKTESQNSNSKTHVYDLTNAGPNRRFTILTDLGPIIVHNCVLGCGYNMGAVKFQAKLAQDAKIQGIELDTSFQFCERVVKAYRAKNANIKQHWHDTQKAAVNAVKCGGEHQVGPYIYFVEGDWLYCRMPCGRRIAYYKPRLVPGKYGPQIAYKGVDHRGKLVTTSTYGGKLVENNTQAVCRDILVDALSRLERAGYSVVLHVHDEAVAEVDENFGSVKEMVQILCETPKWAKGFPVGAEGFESTRYRK